MKTSKATREMMRATWPEGVAKVIDDLDEALALLRRARKAIDPHFRLTGSLDAELLAEVDAALEGQS